MVKHPPSNAGDLGSIPGQETQISHAVGQLGPNAAKNENKHMNILVFLFFFNILKQNKEPRKSDLLINIYNDSNPFCIFLR